jgi:hypothetical protein
MQSGCIVMALTNSQQDSAQKGWSAMKGPATSSPSQFPPTVLQEQLADGDPLGIDKRTFAYRYNLMHTDHCHHALRV